MLASRLYHYVTNITHHNKAMHSGRMAVIMEINQYRIGELAEKANVTKRTIHYYMGRGLLPLPEGAGLGTTYSDEHLYRVLLIKKLQDAYLPLDKIKKRMAGMDLDTVKRYLEGEIPQLKVREQESGYAVKQKVNEAANTEGAAGALYERLEIGFGLELHYPTESREAKELAGMLYKYAQKLLKES